MIRFLLRRRGAVIGTAAVLTIVFGYLATTLRLNNDAARTIPPDLRERVEHEKLKELFNSPYTILFLAQFDSTVDLGARVDSVAAWGAEFETIEGVKRTTHLGTIQVPVKGGFFGLSGEYLVPRGGDGLTGQRLRERLARYSEFTGPTISEDRSVLGMVIELTPEANKPDVMHAVYTRSRRIGALPAIETNVTSEATVAYFINRTMRRDLALLLPLTLITVFLLLYKVFGRLRYVIAPLGIILTALVWTFGIMASAGVPLSIVTSIIPVILFPVGVANAIHIIKTYERRRRDDGLDHEAALIETYAELLRPILLTTITTFAGFGSFAVSRISWTREFGVFTGLGVMIALILTAVLLPLFLPEGALLSAKNREQDRISRAWIRLSGFVLGSRWWAPGVVVVLAISAVGLLRIRVESNPIAMFDRSSELRQSDRIIGRHFGGTRFFSVVLKPPSGKLQSAAQWRKVEEIAAHAGEIPGVGDVQSMLPLLRTVGSMLTGSEYSDAAVSLILESGGLLGKRFGSYVDTWVTGDRSRTRLTVICRNDPELRFRDMAREIEQYVHTNYPDWEVLAAGPAVLTDAMISVLISTQITAFVITLSVVFIVLSLLFGSLRIGVLAIVPIMLSSVFVFAMMGLIGVPINTVTVIIVNTCIGVGIDYSIHFVSGYLFVRHSYADRREALAAALRTKGTVIVWNTLVVGAGFVVLAASGFPPIRQFGSFVCISMVSSCTFSLVLLPVLFSSFGAGLARNRVDGNG